MEKVQAEHAALETYLRAIQEEKALHEKVKGTSPDNLSADSEDWQRWRCAVERSSRASRELHDKLCDAADDPLLWD